MAGRSRFSTHAPRWRGRNLPLQRRGIAIITRLTGLFLSAIAAGMILDGVKNFFHL